VVGLDVVARAMLDLWLAQRPAGRYSARYRGSLKTAYVRALMKRLAATAGIIKRWHTHAFDLVNEGVPLNVISSQLGHRSLAITERYVNHLYTCRRDRSDQQQRIIDSLDCRTRGVGSKMRVVTAGPSACTSSPFVWRGCSPKCQRTCIS